MTVQEERYCIRLDQCPRFIVYHPVPCAECGALIVPDYQERNDPRLRLICFECLTGGVSWPF